MLSGLLRLRRGQREAIAGELRDHLVEHVLHLEQQGVSHDEAVRRAITEFGDAAALAASFSALVRTRRRRLIMRCTIGTTLVMAGLMIGIFAFRPEVEDDPNLARAQGRGSAAKKEPAVKGEGQSIAERRDADAIAREKLRMKTKVEFSQILLSDMLDFISDMTDVQHYLDERSINEAGAAVDSQVTLQLKDVPVDMVLDLVFRQLNLGYTLRNGVMIVQSQDDLRSKTDVRVYRVPEDAAMELAALIPATVDVDSWDFTQPSPHAAGYAGMMGGMGGMPAGAAAPVGGVGGGGPGIGTVRVFRGALVISQTPDVHQKIEKLLADLDPVMARGRPTVDQILGPGGQGLPSSVESGGGYPPPHRGGYGRPYGGGYPPPSRGRSGEVYPPGYPPQQQPGAGATPAPSDPTRSAEGGSGVPQNATESTADSNAAKAAEAGTKEDE